MVVAGVVVEGVVDGVAAADAVVVVVVEEEDDVVGAGVGAVVLV